ncbi:hypothetical protein GUJ93_ZPchr0009g638 [Zizania palustris]|uniref:Uncharacterized protein n=1 Tax=Zizania palustris TaxID=103762 RepID=A0A8J5S183_ZIZPA|nr:hypothetical protein GUJ93_ZPchr0009g638 [Zizania palustris]
MYHCCIALASRVSQVPNKLRNHQVLTNYNNTSTKLTNCYEITINRRSDAHRAPPWLPLLCRLQAGRWRLRRCVLRPAVPAVRPPGSGLQAFRLRRSAAAGGAASHLATSWLPAGLPPPPSALRRFAAAGGAPQLLPGACSPQASPSRLPGSRLGGSPRPAPALPSPAPASGAPPHGPSPSPLPPPPRPQSPLPGRRLVAPPLAAVRTQAAGRRPQQCRRAAVGSGEKMLTQLGFL